MNTAYIAFLVYEGKETPLFVCCGDALSVQTGAEEASLSADILPVLIGQGLIPSNTKGDIVLRKTVLLGKIQEESEKKDTDRRIQRAIVPLGGIDRHAEQEPDIFSAFDPFGTGMPDIQKTALDTKKERTESDEEGKTEPGSVSDPVSDSNLVSDSVPASDSAPVFDNPKSEHEKIIFEGCFLTEEGKRKYRNVLSRKNGTEKENVSEPEHPVAITFYRHHGIRNPRKSGYGMKVSLHVNAYAEGTVETRSGSAWCEGFRVDAVNGSPVPKPLILAGKYEGHPRHASRLHFGSGEPEDIVLEAVFGGMTADGKVLQ